MATLKQNSTYLDGKRVFGNYRIVVSLPTGKESITLPFTKNDREKAIMQQKIANAVETLALSDPTKPEPIMYKNKKYKCWKVYLYSKLELLHKLIKPEIKKVETIYTFEMAYSDMIKYKSNAKQLRDRAINVIRNNQRIWNELMGHNIPVNRFDFKMYEKFLDRLSGKKLHNGKIGYSDTTKNIQVRQLRSLLNYCVKAGHINRVPFNTDDIPKPDESCKDKTYISESAFEQICNLAVKPIYACYWRVAYYTGLRLRELANDPNIPGYHGLWHSIDRKDGLWWIIVEVGKNKGKKKAKTYLPDEVFDDYQQIINNRYYSPDCISKNFTKACRLAGFDQFTFRNTRNSFGANLLRKKKMSPEVVSKLMRHSSLAMTSEYFQDDDYWCKRIKDELN